MNQKFNILTPFILLVTLVLTGCTTTQSTVNDNTKVTSKTNTQNQNSNTNTEIITNANEVVSNANTIPSDSNKNSEQENDVDSSDWQTYSNETIGLQIDYPMPSSNMHFDFTDCLQTKCDSETGASYSLSFLDQVTKKGYAVFGASTPYFAAGRDLGFFDVTYFRYRNGNFEAVLSGDNGFIIHPTKQGSYKSGEVVIYEIKDLPSYPQLVDVMPERKDDKVAIYNFNETVNEFKSISIILTPEMNEQDIDRILNSVVIL